MLRGCHHYRRFFDFHIYSQCSSLLKSQKQSICMTTEHTTISLWCPKLTIASSACCTLPPFERGFNAATCAVASFCAGTFTTSLLEFNDLFRSSCRWRRLALRGPGGRSSSSHESFCFITHRMRLTANHNRNLSSTTTFETAEKKYSQQLRSFEYLIRCRYPQP